MQRLHPDGHYAIGQDCGIYWRLTEPPEKGAVAPDWFYVPNVPPLLDGKIRRSFVLFHELSAPLIALEFASGDGSEERDATPLLTTPEGKSTTPGKFWIYEHVIRIPYYGIYEINSSKLEVYHLEDFTYRKLSPNARDHYPILPLDVELGLWQGCYLGQEQLWLRWWDVQGGLLLIGQERAEQERQRAEQEEHARREAIPRLLNLGLRMEQVAEALELPLEEVRQRAREQ